jgi:hypothetical protein
MPVHVYVFLLVVFLLLCLALLWRLCWLHLQPSHSRGGAIHSTAQRLLKPRTPRDCPCIGYLVHPFPKLTTWSITTLLFSLSCDT